MFCNKPKLKLSQRIPNSLTSVWIYNLINFLRSNFGVSSQKKYKEPKSKRIRKCVFFYYFSLFSLKTHYERIGSSNIASKILLKNWTFSQKHAHALANAKSRPLIQEYLILKSSQVWIHPHLFPWFLPIIQISLNGSIWSTVSVTVERC